MSLYFVNNIASRGAVSATHVVAHPQLPLVASVWTNPLHVLVTDSEGESVADHTPKPQSQSDGTKATDDVTCLAWHPARPVLAIGTRSGKLLVWTLPPTKPTDANFTLHPPVDVESARVQHVNGSVTACEWSGSGAYLVTAADSKRAVMWVFDSGATAAEGEADSAGKPAPHSTVAPQWSVTTDETVTHAMRVATPTVVARERSQRQQRKPAAEGENAEGSTTANPQAAGLDDGESECVFILASSKGKTIFGLSEEQKLFPLATMEETAAAVLYDPVERYLVALSLTHMLTVYRVTPTIVAELVMRRKLSIPVPGASSNRNPLAMEWVSAGVLVFGCGDDRVRFFNVQSDRMYVVMHPLAPSAHVVHIATLTKKGLLVMATAEGSVAVFQKPSFVCQGSSSPYDAMGVSAFDVGMRSGSAASSNAFNKGTEKAGAFESNGDPAAEWELLTVVKVEDRVERLCFSGNNYIYVTLSNGKLQMLRETVRKRAWDGVAAATQISMEVAVVESVTGCQCLLKSSSKIYGVSIAFPIIGLWNGYQIDLYTVNEATSTATLTSSVPSKNPAFAIHQSGIFYVRDTHRIVFSSFQMIMIGQIAFTEAEGVPTLVDVMSDVVVALSSENAMRLAIVNSNEVTPLGPPRLLPKLGNDLVVTSIKVNAEGRRVALMARCVSNDQPDTRVWVYDADTDLMFSYDFMERMEIPHAVYWNTPEPNGNSLGEPGYLLLACETHQLKGVSQPDEQKPTGPQGNVDGRDTCSPPEHRESGVRSPKRTAQPTESKSKEATNGAMPDLENFAEAKGKSAAEDAENGFSAVNPLAHRSHNLVTLFATNRGLVVHNSVELKRYHICLVGLTIPDFLLTSVRINGDPGNPEDYMIEQKRLRDFEGLKTEKDAAVLEALMKFSYYSTVGNMDEAYRCVKTIKTATVWQSLAKMCVASGRLDVASVCLAQMQDGVAASALRVARTNYPGEKEVQVATLACSLGLVRECEELLRKAKRFDLITDLFIACGKFEQAQRHAREHDRIRVYPVAYKYAQFMESFSNFDAAVMWYCNARCLDTDVVRLYFQNGRLSDLRLLVTPPEKKRESAEVATVDKARSNAEAEAPANPASSLTDPKSVGIAGDGEVRAASAGGNPKSDDRGHDDNQVQPILQKLFAHNPELLHWWARQAERRKKFSEATNFYTLAGDVFNTVRLLFNESPPKTQEAIDIVDNEIKKRRSEAESSRTPLMQSSPNQSIEPVGAAYFVGKHYERNGDVTSALKYYQHAGAWRAAAKVAKSHERHSELLTIAQNSEDTHLMLDCAAFLEHNGVYEMSVDLYHRIGDIQKAIDVCIKGKQYDAMHRISSTLNAEKDAEVFLQMASHFVESGHYTKAAEMYIFAREYPSALTLCVERGVGLTDEMADAITAEAKRRQLSDDQKTELERQIASIARDQGNWNLACRKYTQLGERVKAMKMLMRGGDVKKVIFFANHSRSTEIYTLAGNFLQSQNWHTDANIHKHIVLFYTRSKAFTNLISYIDSYAQLQIDENRNYYDAWCALDECIGQVERNRDAMCDVNITGKMEGLRVRRDIVAQAVKAVKLLADSGKGEEQAKEFIAVCSDLVKRSRPSHKDHADITSSIRIGDIFALLVRHYHENMKASTDAMRVIDSMVKHGAEPQFFVERDLLESVCKSNGRRLSEFVSGDNITDNTKDDGVKGGRQMEGI
ncbi:hypothetical protein, conserved [Trypanosoma brucei gambiense DAL972]|uniref:Intraflagellar transport protein 140 n=1 Tax=Trypanosoma brucei gambiense (strain MHOM/CI/86/DAL972) TaxID=679716 RepID=D0A098_TRYB9|nr:hypothetical protein, conserved [Trypanosoma brucei gambiense DAL972]CBH16656.1 hypothetical protein, conserved [Trypanosoma brucei gambiense DAL972]|eukprot:XP_011778920.1 hypothetical protein, conserved [Trypanosoma brucei gambiense DAL972]